MNDFDNLLDGLTEDAHRRRLAELAEMQRQTALLREIQRVLSGPKVRIRRFHAQLLYWKARFEFRRYGRKVTRGT